jgi:NitT/TauT family transport system substrate-binding protein
MKPICKTAVASAALAALALIAGGTFAPREAGAEAIKIGLSKVLASGAVAIAQEKGYFAAEGVPAELVFFDSAQPIAVAAAAREIDFGAAGLTGGFYNLAGQGALRIIAGAASEASGFKNIAVLVSNRADAAGLKSVKDLSGHSVAITQVGTALHYDLGLVAEKYGVDLKSIRILPLQSNTNIASALTGAQADAAVVPSTLAMPLVQRGDAKLLAWVGDEIPGLQANVAFTATKNANDRRPLVEAFLRAYKKGARDYYEAFSGPDGKRKDGPTAPVILAILAKFTGQPVEQVALAIPYVDGDARLDMKDLRRQIAWYKSQNLLKGDIKADELIDKRYAMPMPDNP